MTRRRSRADKRHTEHYIKGGNRRLDEPPDLLITTEVKENDLLIRVEHAMFASNCYALRDAIDAVMSTHGGLKQVIINMEKVPYAETAAFSLFLKLKKRLAQRNVSFVLYRVKRRVKEIIDMLNMDKVFDMREH